MNKITRLPKAAQAIFKSIVLFIGLGYLATATAFAQGTGNVQCPPNVDFENGDFTNWQCWLGKSAAGASRTSVIFTTPFISGPVVGRHRVTTATPLTLDPYGHFPVTPPGGGNYALKLGRDSASNSAERVRYYVHVPVGFNDYSFNYKFAPVLQDPDFGNPDSTTWNHKLEQKPAFRIQAFDSATGVEIPCATQSYVASYALVNTYGFTQADTGTQVIFLPWTNGAIPVVGQGGKTIYIQIESLGCSQGGHWGYGYFDVISCGQYKASVTYCNLDSGLIRFVGTGVNQTYNWYSSNGTYVGQGAYVDVPVPSTPDYFYGVIASGSPGCLDTIYTDTVSNFILDAIPGRACVKFGNTIQLDRNITGGLSPFTTSWTANPELSCLTCNNPIASPRDTTSYIVTVSDKVGCFRKDTVHILQGPEAGPDLKVCPLGERPVQLHVSGPTDAVYHWYSIEKTPAEYLSCTDCQNPVAGPLVPVYTYVVESELCHQTDTVTVYHDTTNYVVAPQDPFVVCRPSYVTLQAEAFGPKPLTNLACGTTNPMTCAVADQDTVTIGRGLVPNARPANTPFYSEMGFHKYQFILKKRDLLYEGFYSGTINSIAFRTLSTAIAGAPVQNITISLACLNADTFQRPINNQSFINGVTLTPVVTLASYTLTPDSWNKIDLTTPYNWDTSKNLLVDICMGPMNTPNAAGTGVEPIAMMDGQSIQKASNSVNVCSGSTPSVTEYAQRPVVQFTYCPTPELPFQYTWLPGTYLQDSTVQNPSAYIPRSVNYAVYSVGRNGCRLRDSVHIIVPHHELGLGPIDTFICQGQPAFMRASGGLDGYQWYEVKEGVFTTASSLNDPTSPTPIATPRATTTYAVIYFNNKNESNPINPNASEGCPDTLFVTVNVWNLPPVRITNGDTTIGYGRTVHLYAKGASNYSWTPVGSLNDPNSPAPFATPKETTNYIVSGKDSNGCVYRDTVKVTVNFRDNLLIPSAFTPNGDGRNDEFRIINASYQRLMEFRVFNRWGQEIFSTTDINKGWDGTWKGVPQDVGNFQYIIRVGYPDGNVETYKGDVSIIK